MGTVSSLLDHGIQEITFQVQIRSAGEPSHQTCKPSVIAYIDSLKICPWSTLRVMFRRKLDCRTGVYVII